MMIPYAVTILSYLLGAGRSTQRNLEGFVAIMLGIVAQPGALANAEIVRPALSRIRLN
jgi:hypothetical protein